MELDDTADSNSKEEQDTDMFFDNGIYEKIPSKQRGKNTSVELTDMVGKSSAENKDEQDMAISVDNVCYDKLPSELYPVHPKSNLYVLSLKQCL